MIIQIWALLNTIIMFPMMMLQLIIGAIMYYLGNHYKNKKWKIHGLNLALGVDQYMNVVWLGYPDETISSRTGRSIASKRPKWYIKYALHPFVDWAAQLFGDGPNHCIRAIEVDEVKKGDFEVWKWFRD